MKFGLPPVPTSLDSVHPVVVHFPIVLLLVAPVFVLLGMLKPERTRCFSWAALLLMAMGVASAWVSVLSGFAAMQLAAVFDEGQEVLEEHEHMALATRTAFTVALGVYAALLLVPALRKRELSRGWGIALHGVFLTLYAAATALVVWTGHLGGRLVHEFGAHALL